MTNTPYEIFDRMYADWERLFEKSRQARLAADEARNKWVDAIEKRNESPEIPAEETELRLHSYRLDREYDEAYTAQEDAWQAMLPYREPIELDAEEGA